jgi:hypothetical protein
MRKLALLVVAAVTMLGLAAGTAHAGRLIDFQGNPATVTGTGTLTTPDGFIELGSPTTGAQGLESETATPWSKPAPGTINMRINLFVNEFPMATWWSGMNGNGTPAANAGNKQQPFGIYGWIRLDFGIDGRTKNGIIYGAFVEIRENNTTNVTGGTTSVSGGFGQSASADSNGNTLYVRHANVYLGTDEVGFLRIGTAIGADNLLETGINDDYDISWMNLSNNTSIPNNLNPVWPWADAGPEYMAARIAYASPMIFGFDGVISFAPNNSTPFDGSGCSEPYGGVGCTTQSSSQLAGDIGRYRNQLSMGLRYRNAFGPIGLAIAGIWTVSGKVNAVGPQQFNGLNVGNVGAQVTLNHYLSVGSNVLWGAYNGAWGLQPVGGATAVAWTVGGKYTIPQAPMMFGVNYFDYKYQGQAGLPTQRVSRGLDLGATYGLGPGIVLLAEYLWGENKQGDFNFLTNSVGPASNKVWCQILTAGMSVRF